MTNVLGLIAALSLMVGELLAQELRLRSDTVRNGAELTVDLRGGFSGLGLQNGLAQRSQQLNGEEVPLGKIRESGFYSLKLVSPKAPDIGYLLIALPHPENRSQLKLQLIRGVASPTGEQRRSLEKLMRWMLSSDGIPKSAKSTLPNWAKENAAAFTGTFAICTTATVAQPLVIVCADRLKDHAIDAVQPILEDLIQRCPSLSKKERKTLTALVKAGYFAKNFVSAKGLLEKSLEAVELGSELFANDDVQITTKLLSGSAKSHIAIVRGFQ